MGFFSQEKKQPNTHTGQPMGVRFDYSAFGFDDKGDHVGTKIQEVYDSTPSGIQRGKPDSKILTFKERERAGVTLGIQPSALNWYSDKDLGKGTETFSSEVETVMSFFQKRLELIVNKSDNARFHGELSREAYEAIQNFTKQERKNLRSAGKKKNFLTEPYREAFSERINGMIRKLSKQDRFILTGDYQPEPKKMSRWRRFFVSTNAHDVAKKVAKQKTREFELFMQESGVPDHPKTDLKEEFVNKGQKKKKFKFW